MVTHESLYFQKPNQTLFSKTKKIKTSSWISYHWTKNLLRPSHLVLTFKSLNFKIKKLVRSNKETYHWSCSKPSIKDTFICQIIMKLKRQYSHGRDGGKNKQISCRF